VARPADPAKVSDVTYFTQTLRQKPTNTNVSAPPSPFGWRAQSTWRWTLWWGLLCLCLVGQPVLAQDAPRATGPRIVSLASWLDTPGHTPLEALEAVAQWAPFVGWKNHGFGPEPVWVRIDIAGADPDAPNEDWVLQIRPAYLDQLQLFDPTTGTVQRLGDYFDTRDDILGSFLFSFRVRALPEARTLYLRLESTSVRTLYLELMGLQEAQKRTRKTEWLLGFVLSLSAVFSAWAWMQWLGSREAVMGAFAVKQTIGTLWGVFFLGVARVVIGDWLPPGVLTALSSVLMPLLLASVLLFMAQLYLEYRPRRWALRSMHGMALLILSALLLQPLGMTGLSLMLMSVAVPIGLSLIVLTLWTAQAKPGETTVPRFWIGCYVCFYGGIQSIAPLSHLGLLQEGPLIFYGNLTHLVLDAFVMVGILHLRSRKLAALQRQTEASLQLAQEQARLNRHYLQDQQRLLAMLAHEIKTPLTSMRLWMQAGPQGQAVMERTIADMSSLIERCVQTGQVNDQSLQPVWQTLDAVDLTEHVVNKLHFKPRLVMALPEGFAWVKVDAQMLQIVLSNVLDNAHKYSPPRSPIHLTLSAQPGPEGQAGWQWCIDNAQGPGGLPDPDRLYDKYYRSPHAQRLPGSGLGLFLVKSLMEMMGGQVRYTPQDDRVRFELWVAASPIAPPPDATETTAPWIPTRTPSKS
jgi:two-component system, sensor histidine kinase LadS